MNGRFERTDSGVCWRMTPRSAAKVGAVPALSGLILLWVAWLVELDPDDADGFLAILHWLDSTSWGRWAITVWAVYVVGLSLLSLIAGFRGFPALSLDDDGVSAWAGYRTRRVPWGDVESIYSFSIAGRWGIPGHVVIGTRGRDLKISAIHFDMTAEDAAAAIRSWNLPPPSRRLPPPPPSMPPQLMPPPMVPPTSKRSGWVTAIIVGVVCLVGLGGCVSLVVQRRDSTRDEIEVLECGTDDLGFMRATVAVTNNSSDRSGYIVSVSFESPDGATQYETGVAIVSGLDGGYVRAAPAGTLERPPGEFVCVVDDVSRTSAES